MCRCWLRVLIHTYDLWLHCLLYGLRISWLFHGCCVIFPTPVTSSSDSVKSMTDCWQGLERTSLTDGCESMMSWWRGYDWGVICWWVLHRDRSVLWSQKNRERCYRINRGKIWVRFESPTIQRLMWFYFWYLWYSYLRSDLGLTNLELRKNKTPDLTEQMFIVVLFSLHSSFFDTKLWHYTVMSKVERVVTNGVANNVLLMGIQLKTQTQAYVSTFWPTPALNDISEPIICSLLGDKGGVWSRMGKCLTGAV